MFPGVALVTPLFQLFTDLNVQQATGTAPEDFVEGNGLATTLVPQSLYDDQRRLRIGH